jgi:endonuclease V-like protein UPF0215 family
MPLHVHKKGIRALGVAESFVKKVGKKSIISGVVMRSDMIIDGFTFSNVTVGGMDATQKIIELYESMERDDVNLILLNGCIISWYNVVELDSIANSTTLPLICITYEDSKGLERYFKEYFPDDWELRIEIYKKNGSRTPLKIWTGHTVYTRFIGMNEEEALIILNKFTLNGAVPEPLRVARLLSRSLMKKQSNLF